MSKERPIPKSKSQFDQLIKLCVIECIMLNGSNIDRTDPMPKIKQLVKYITE